MRSWLMQVTEDREAEMRGELDELTQRHVEIKRKFRSLYLAYRKLRWEGGHEAWGGTQGHWG